MVSEEVLDAVETVLDYAAGHDDVAHAEVGGVVRDHADVLVTREGPRHDLDLESTGVWFRVFADGAADYRYEAVLEEDHLIDAADRAIRAAETLGQTAPARYDPATSHRAGHGGWAREGDSLARVSTEEVASTLHEALAGPDWGPADRVRVAYRGENLEEALMTTSGTTLRTTLDRAWIEAAADLPDARRVSTHAGSTAGAAFLRGLDDRLAAFAGEVRRLTGRERTSVEPGEREVVLGPAAAGRLFHQLVHYLEADMGYLGASPLGEGDRIGPPALSIEDGVRAGSFAARAFDAEGRPTQPVTLVDRGEVTNLLHNTASAAEADAAAGGHAVTAIGHEQAPRIHARHLDVAPGSRSVEELREGAAVEVQRLGEPRIEHEATRVKRESEVPPSVGYARDVAADTPDEFDDEVDDQQLSFPIQAGYELAGRERADRLAGAELVVDLEDLRTVDGLGVARETTTGVCEKHDSRLPFAVTAPAVELSCRLR